MGRSPCCSKEGLNRGAWTAIEDKILTAYIKGHGEGNWRNLPKRAGLKRCGKSCRLRWLNYLRPDIKRGNISHDEEELIIRLHKLLGNRWSLIAGRLPGRTDNEIKNYWNTRLGKKAAAQTSSQPPRNSSISKCRVKKKTANESKVILIEPPTAAATRAQPIRTKALRCTKVLVPPFPIYMNSAAGYSSQLQAQQSQAMNNLKIDNGTDEELHVSYSCSSNFLNMVGCDEFQAENNGDTKRDYNYNNNLSMGSSDFSLPFDEPIFKEWATNNYLEDNVTIDLGSLPFLLDYEEWP